jgi:hypothetical protein
MVDRPIRSNPPSEAPLIARTTHQKARRQQIKPHRYPILLLPHQLLPLIIPRRLINRPIHRLLIHTHSLEVTPHFLGN